MKNSFEWFGKTLMNEYEWIWLVREWIWMLFNLIHSDSNIFHMNRSPTHKYWTLRQFLLRKLIEIWIGNNTFFVFLLLGLKMNKQVLFNWTMGTIFCIHFFLIKSKNLIKILSSANLVDADSLNTIEIFFTEFICGDPGS